MSSTSRTHAKATTAFVVALVVLSLSALTACSGGGTVSPGPTAPTGVLELRFGGYDEAVCARLTMPSSTTRIAVTMTIAPGESVVDPDPVITSTDDQGVARASWALRPGLAGSWTVVASLDTPEGVATASAVAGTGLTGNERTFRNPPCE